MDKPIFVECALVRLRGVGIGTEGKLIGEKTTFHKPVQGRAESLTTIRFFAAAMVFCDHYASDLLSTAPFAIRNLLDRGSAGVQLFFILSGFLMVIVYGSRAGTIDRRSFYVNRVARIYPAYLFALLLSLQMAYSWVKSVGFAPGLNVPVYVLSKFTMTDGWYFGRYSADTAFNWMQQGWSLSSEVLFYALFPLMLPLVLRLKSGQAALLGAIALGLGQLFSRGLGALSQVKEGIVAQLHLAESGFSPPVNLPTFLIGMAVGRIVLEHGPKFASYTTARRGVIAAAILYQAMTPESQSPQWYFTGLQIMYALLIGALGLEFYDAVTPRTSKVKEFFIVLGEASYSLYLLQAAVHSWLVYLFAKLHLSWGAGGENWGFFLFSFVCANALAVLVWRTFEGPARKWIQARFAK